MTTLPIVEIYSILSSPDGEMTLSKLDSRCSGETEMISILAGKSKEKPRF